MLNPGTKLGPYEILAPLGAGGMGEVYRARDTKLGREVALKVLPEAFAKDGERMARFQREAQVLAALNHPNIAAIYGLEESGATPALVMELVEGPTLAERVSVAPGFSPARAGLKAGSTVGAQGRPQGAPLPVDETLRIAKQIAEGLEAAHEKGVIHRDLKPANVKVRPDGTVKVLDFGLAKAFHPPLTPSPSPSGRGWPEGPGEGQNSPTWSIAPSQPGLILGTASYMSPEQARGKPVDKRADIWSFGCVLYEALTGRQAFGGETVSDTLAGILGRDPDWRALPAGTPAKVVDLLRRCLQKDAKLRLHDIADARIEIDEVLDPSRPMPVIGGGLAEPRAAKSARRLWTVGLAAVVAGAAVLLALVLLLRQPPPPERMQFTMPVQAPVSHLALSADGRMLAFVARDDASGEDMLYAQGIGSPNASLLAGTEGASYPFWSPDGAYVGFFSSGKLKKVAVAGGFPQAIAEATRARGGAWGKRGSSSTLPIPEAHCGE